MSRILVVDDKEMMRDSVATTLARKQHTVITAADGSAALAKISEKQPDVIITDLQMPEMNGVELLEAVRRLDEQLPVIIMTAYGTIETAVRAMKQGAFDYITKPFSGDELALTVQRALEHARLVRENQVLRATVSEAATGGRQHAMIGSGSIMSDLRERLTRIADSHGTVLITGESGSGKEVAARFIHQHSPRADKPFLAINCAALSTSLLESELFGHEKGAFTGADKLRKGRFELADGGTLLLDEISEVDPGIQAKLLRVLQEQLFERVGSSTSQTADVRVIATTNRSLPEEVARGRFRQDLYFRLNVLPVPMPALRERPDDLAELVAHFLKEVARREGKTVKRMTDEALSLMSEYPWPGNVRELQNITERAVVLASGGVIDAALIRPWLEVPVVRPQGTMIEPKMQVAAASVGFAPSPEATTSMANANGTAVERVCEGEVTLEDIERETIVATLEHFRGHRQRTAEALGIGVRTLGLKLKKWKEQSLVDQNL